MTRAVRGALMALSLLIAPALAGCQSPTSPDDTPNVNDILTISVTPDPALADVSTDGKTYRVVRGNNQPDDILTFDWKTAFTLTVTLNDRADDRDYDIHFPVDLTTITLQVKQASGGIVTPPAAGETEYFTHLTQASGNRFPGINSSASIAFDVWYDLPNLRKEALVIVNLSFRDTDGDTFSTSKEVRVAP